MRASDLRKSFPNRTLPELLEKLCAYSERMEESISCDFELADDGNDAALAWFDKDAEAAKQFVVFGRDGAGSLYGYWLHEGRSLAQAPIVYLNGEGSGSTVLANSLQDFLILLATGKDEIGMAKAWKATKKPCKNTEAYRAWLKDETGLAPPEDPGALVQDAKKAHPDLNAWIKEWMKHHKFR